MTGPTQPADDLRARIATSLQFSFVGAEMDRRDTENVTLTVHDTEKAGDRLLAAVVGPYLARLREENAQLAADRADAVRGYEQERDAATAAHTRNAVLRSEHRTEVEQLRAEYDQAVEDWGRNDEQVLADSARLAEENERLRAELVAIGAQRDDAEEERASMVRDLHAAVFDGSTLLPDRPLDTVWEYLLGCVRNDPARLSGGNTPADAEETAARAIHRFMSSACSWEELPEGVRPTYLGQARAALAAVGWGSAVATPDDADEIRNAVPESVDEVIGARSKRTWYRRPDDCWMALERPGDQLRLVSERCLFVLEGSVSPAPSVGADPEDEVLAELREDIETADSIRVAPGTGCVLIDLVPEWNPGDKAVWRIDDDAPGEPVEIVKVVGTTAFVASGDHRYTVDTAELSLPAAVADTAHERTEP